MKILITILPLFFLLYCYGQTINTKKTDVEKANLIGKVQQVKQESYYYTTYEGETSKSYMAGEYNCLMVYNEQGTEIEKNIYGSHDYRNILTLDEKYTYKYDGKGNRIEENVCNADGRLVRKHIYKYNEKGNVIEESKYYSYDSSSTYQITTYKYDDKENRIEANNSRSGKTTYKYDDKGNMIEEGGYAEDESGDYVTPYKSTYKYNDKRKKIEEISYCPTDSSTFQKFTYKYDDKGNEIECNLYFNKNLSSDYNYIYKYDYDKQGNWIKKTLFTNGVEQLITTREIKYFSQD